jgi:hypothetical protein
VPFVARSTFAAAAEWLGRRNRHECPDGNLSNHLWDGERVQIIDFEYLGRSGRVFELAEIAAHISARVSGAEVTSSRLWHFELTAAETVRLPECRRLIAPIGCRCHCAKPRRCAGSLRNPGAQAQRSLTLPS